MRRSGERERLAAAPPDTAAGEDQETLFVMASLRAKSRPTDKTAGCTCQRASRPYEDEQGTCC